MTMQNLGVMVMAVVTLLSGAALLFENARPAYAQSPTTSLAVSSASTGLISTAWIVDPVKQQVILCIQSNPAGEFTCRAARLPEGGPALMFKSIN